MHIPLLSAAVALSCAAAVCAIPTKSHVLHEKRNDSPHSPWKRHSRAQGHEILPVRIGLKQRNLEHAEKFIEEISSPSSPSFGQHWSAEKVAEVFAPAKETRDNILNWLIASGVDAQRLRHSTGKNWIEFNATISEAEKLLNTEYHFYKHQEIDGYRIACDSYGLPGHVKDHVDFVMPTVQLDGLQPIKNARPALQAPSPVYQLNGTSNCSALITIDCLRALYQFPAGKHNHTGNQMGIAEWADYLYYPDLDPFFANFTSPKIPAGTRPEFISIDGGKPSNLTVAKAQQVVESALDFQSAYSIIWPQQTRLYQNGDSVNVDSTGTFNIFLDALDASYCTYLGGDQPYIDPAYPDPNEGDTYTGPLQCGGAPRSNVISISYGQIEAALPPFYQQRQCHEWMKLALQGTTVVVSSGDSGVANRYNSGYNNSCVNSQYGYVDTYGDRFSPSFPVNCPYVTAVGATFVNSNDLSAGESAVASPNNANHLLDYYSGGGFSDVFAVPSYQKAATKNYIKHYAPKEYSSKVYNNTGHARGFPDISAIGLKVATVYLNKTYGVGGTSASAPIVGGIITLLNEERLAIGKKPIGFLNPILYAHPEMLNDVVNGSNPGCGTDGFPAAPGWDPVTGLGTPNYPKMREVFLRLP